VTLRRVSGGGRRFRPVGLVLVVVMSRTGALGAGRAPGREAADASARAAWATVDAGGTVDPSSVPELAATSS